MKKLFLTGLSAIAIATPSLYPAVPEIADSPLQPFAYAKIAPIQGTVTKLGQALQAIKPGPQTMMVTAGMGMALGDPTFASFDAKANTGVYVFNDFSDDDEPTVVVLLKVAKESPVPAALTKNMGLNASTHGDWTVLTNHPEALKKIPDLGPLANFTNQKTSGDLETGLWTAPFLANAFIKESLDELKESTKEIEDKDQATAAAALLDTALGELADIETAGISLGIGNTAFDLAYGLSLKPGSELAKGFQAPGGQVPSAGYLEDEGLFSGSFAYKKESYFNYFRYLVNKLKPSLKGDLEEILDYSIEYLEETEEMLPETLAGAINFSFSMDGIVPKPDLNMVMPMDITLEKIEEYQKREQEMGLKITKLLAGTPGLEDIFEPGLEWLEKNQEGEDAGPKKVTIAGVPAIHFKQPLPQSELGLLGLGEEEEGETVDFGYYITVNDGLFMMSTSEEGVESILKRQSSGEKAAKPLATKLEQGEIMKGNFNVKPYFEMMMGMMMMFGGDEEGENPIMKEMEALEISPWPILATAKDNNLQTSIDVSYASLKTLTDFSEKAMKASMGSEGSPSVSLDIEDSKIDYSKIDIPMDLPFALSNGGTTTLAQLTKGKKAVLLDFWASWCGPCMALMPELTKKEAALSKQGIVVAGMNTEGEPETAEKTRKKLDIKFNWLVEPDDAPLSDLLEIDSIPRMVLISPEGKVLYNGHPQDPSLNAALAQLGVDI